MVTQFLKNKQQKSRTKITKFTNKKQITTFSQNPKKTVKIMSEMLKNTKESFKIITEFSQNYNTILTKFPQTKVAK